MVRFARASLTSECDSAGRQSCITESCGFALLRRRAEDPDETSIYMDLFVR